MSLQDVYEKAVLHGDIIVEAYKQEFIDSLKTKFQNEEPSANLQQILLDITRFDLLRIQLPDLLKNTANAIINKKAGSFSSNTDNIAQNPIDIKNYSYKQLNELLNSFKWYNLQQTFALVDRFKTKGSNLNTSGVLDLINKFHVLRTQKTQELSRFVVDTVNSPQPPEAFIYDANKAKFYTESEFNENLAKLKKAPLDINNYTPGQLEDIVASFNWIEDTSQESGSTFLPATEGFPAPVLYNHDGIQVLFAQNFAESKKIRSWLQQEDNFSYTFCIGGSENHYYTYRIGDQKDTIKSIYYVRDINKPSGDLNRVNVIMAQRNGLYHYTQALNNRDYASITWEEVEKKNPRLRVKDPEGKNPIKEVIKFVPLTQQEEEVHLLSRINEGNFSTLTSYRLRYLYIATENPDAGNNPLNLYRKITRRDFATLNNELKHAYISTRGVIGQINDKPIGPEYMLLNLTSNLFSDIESKEIFERINATQAALDKKEKKWLDPLTLDTTVMKHCVSSTRAYYKSLIYRFIGALGGKPIVNDAAGG